MRKRHHLAALTGGLLLAAFVLTASTASADLRMVLMEGGTNTG